MTLPDDIFPGESDDIVITFDANGQTGDFSASLVIVNSSTNLPELTIPVTARVEPNVGETALTLINPEFDIDGWGNTESPEGWTSGGSSYGQGAPATPNLNSIAAHLQANSSFYQQNLSVANPGLTAADPELVTIALDAAYRNDTSTNGDIFLRVSLWDVTNDVEIVGRDLVLEDEGVVGGAAANQLIGKFVSLSYDRSGFTSEELGIRIAHIAPTLGSQPWTATAIIDNVEVAINGDFEAPSGPYVDWASSSGLTAGLNDGLGDDPDNSGVVNAVEFFLNGNPLNAADNGQLQVLADEINENGLILIFAAPAGTDFAGGATATIDGVTCVVEGSLNLIDFSASVSEVVPAVVPASWPAPADGWQYHSFRLDGSSGFEGSGFLRLSFDN